MKSANRIRNRSNAGSCRWASSSARNGNWLPFGTQSNLLGGVFNVWWQLCVILQSVELIQSSYFVTDYPGDRKLMADFQNLCGDELDNHERCCNVNQRYLRCNIFEVGLIFVCIFQWSVKLLIQLCVVILGNSFGLDVIKQVRRQV